MLIKNRFIRNDHIIISVLFLFHAINNYVILSYDKVPLVNDEYHYFKFSGKIHSILKERLAKGKIIEFHKYFFKQGYKADYPPLFVILPAIAYLFFGISPDIAIYSNNIYMLIILFSLYGIGNLIFDRKAGLYAAIIMFLPGIFAFSRTVYPDFAIAAMISLTAYLLLKVDNFRNTYFSFMLGLVIGIEFLIKWRYPFYMLGPLSCIIIYSIKNRRVKLFKNIAICLLSAFLVTGLYIIPNWNIILKGICDTLVVKSIPHSDKPFYYGFYPIAILTHLLHPFFLFLFLLSLIII